MLKGVFDISYKHTSKIDDSAYKSNNVTNPFLACSHANEFYKSRQSPKVFCIFEMCLIR